IRTRKRLHLLRNRAQFHVQHGKEDRSTGTDVVTQTLVPRQGYNPTTPGRSRPDHHYGTTVSISYKNSICAGSWSSFSRIRPGRPSRPNQSPTFRIADSGPPIIAARVT